MNVLSSNLLIVSLDVFAALLTAMYLLHLLAIAAFGERNNDEHITEKRSLMNQVIRSRHS